jgi:iron complex outermembrane recepter protein
VDQLRAPDSSISGLLRHRANYGISWHRPGWGVGLDGHYYGARNLPMNEWASQGGPRIRAHQQFDLFVQGDLTAWLPHAPARYGLRAQARVNNVFDQPFPAYANDPSSAGVRPYGDWRGRTYSLSVSATF